MTTTCMAPAVASFKPASDPIPALARDIARLASLHEATQTEEYRLRQAGDIQAAAALDRKARQMLDNMNANERAIASLKASSIEGALAQLYVLGTKIDQRGDYGPEEMEAADALDLDREIRSLLYSIAGVLQAAAAVDDEDLGASYYMIPDLSPFAAAGRA